MISVVIPYFQRSPGVLRRALASVAAQRDCPLPIHVIVVDDGSPLPPEDEIAAAALADGLELTLIRQANAGPGAARNAGIAAAPAETRYIAFLDSDDEWSVDHLARAVEALAQGFTFYFADLYQIGQTVGAFARGGRMNLRQHHRLPTHSADLYAYQGDLFDQVLRGNVIGTPTVVYCWRTFSATRFQLDLRSAGEDYLFWMTLASQGAKAAFSAQIETTCGAGVNVYAGSGWGTDAHMRRVHDEIKFRQLIARIFLVTTQQRDHIKADLRDLRLAFVRDLMHRVKRRKPVPWRLLLAHARLDPMTFMTRPFKRMSIRAGR